MNTPAGWDGILGHGEEILWQGQPRTSIQWRDALSFQSAFGLFFAGFALFWITGAAAGVASSDAPGIFFLFPLFGLPFLAIGLYMMAGHLIWDAYRRSGTHYTLTTRNAYVARAMLGKRTLETWPLGELSHVTLEDGHPGAVLFGVSDASRLSHATGDPVRPSGLPGTIGPAPIGFRLLDDPRRVYRLLRDAQAALERPAT